MKDKILYTQHRKPTSILCIFLAVSLIFALFRSTRFIGILMAVVFVVLLLTLKDRIILDITERYIKFYDYDDNDITTYVYLDEIKSFAISDQGQGTRKLIIELSDDTVVTLPTAYADTVNRVLLTLISEKQKQ